MSLKKLIEGQLIIIDDHKRGNREVKNWDDPSIDIHIDKKTNFPVNGKMQNIRIRVPINSDRPIKIENRQGNSLEEIPQRLKKEIRNAFSDTKKRREFIADVVNTLENYETVLSNAARAQEVLDKLSKHFDLAWTSEIITSYLGEVLRLYTQNYLDNSGRQYFITLSKEEIKIGEDNGYAKSQKYKTQSGL